jgi:hypothetical protein
LGFKKKVFVNGATANNTTRIGGSSGAVGNEGKDKGYLILLVIVVLLGMNKMIKARFHWRRRVKKYDVRQERRGTRESS